MHSEEVRILKGYLRIDTTNPPGNELAAAHFLADILEREGIPATIFEPAPGRANLVARLPGRGKKPSLMFLNHMDVVGVEPQHWSVDPFGGEIRDGYLWGRGALDMKGMAVMQLCAMLKAKREHLPLERDLIFLAVADEEEGGRFGAQWMIEHYPELVQAEFIVNEGSFGICDMPGVRLPVFPCATAEKGPLWLKVALAGEAGHGSMPPDNHAPHRLVRSLNRLLGARPRPVLGPEVARLLADLGAHMPTLGAAWLMGHLGHPLIWPLASRVLLRKAALRAILTNTFSVDMLASGHKANVVPSEATAVIDCRLLPGVDPAAFAAWFRGRLRLEDAQLEVLYSEAGSTSPMDTELFQAYEAALRGVYPECVFTANLSAGFSDSRFFRRRGMVAYGLIPIVLAQNELPLIHGHDERIGVEALEKGTAVLYDLIRRLG